MEIATHSNWKRSNKWKNNHPCYPETIFDLLAKIEKEEMEEKHERQSLLYDKIFNVVIGTLAGLCCFGYIVSLFLTFKGL